MNDAHALEKTSMESLVGQVADEFIERLNRGEQPEIEEYTERYPQIATVLRDVLRPLRVMRTLGAEPTSGVGVASSAGPPDEGSEVVGRLGDFRIVREIGRGGMGVVYEAEQVSLGRRVALKVFPFAAVMDQRSLQRFKNEAQAAAQLHHTNIVPVFSVGCERGVHYYAMQYIDGQPLTGVIRELRRLSGVEVVGNGQAGGMLSAVASSLAAGRWAPVKPPATEASSAVESLPAESGSSALGGLSTEGSTRSPAFFRGIATLGVQVADALEHAHDTGVIHRDVKPSNLMLETGGQIWITDFGLAQCQSDAGQTLTMAGDLLGTIRYMSPEQALAKRVVIDHRTDIYSLGVTLYELLTLEPAFKGQDRQELLRQIAFEEPRRPQRVNDAIPADLETIVLKAIAKNPAERYETAKEVAEDLERFLADKPILAKRPTVAQRATKWSRRHKPVVASAAVLLVLAVIGLAISTVMIAREQARTAAEQRRTEAALRQVRMNFQKARDAVDKYYTFTSQSTLLERPDLLALRKDLLDAALTYYKDFAEQRTDDPEIQAELVATYFRIAVITHATSSGDWLPPLAKGVEIADKLVRRDVDVSRFPSWRAGIIKFRGQVAGIKPGEGLRSLHRASQIWGGLVRQHPDVPGFQRDLAAIQYVLAEVRENSLDKLGWYDRARETLAKLIRQHPPEPDGRLLLGVAQKERAAVLTSLGRHKEAAEARREAVDVAEGLVTDFPGVPEYENALANTCKALSLMLLKAGSCQEAEKAWLRAVAVQEKLVADFPTVPIHGKDLNTIYGVYGKAAVQLRQDGRHQDAEKAYRAAQDLWRKLAADAADKPEYKRQLAVCSLWLGGLLIAEPDRQAEADKEFRQARAVVDKLLADFPDSHGLGNVRDPNEWLGRKCGPLAWQLVTEPNCPLRDARSAVELGKRAVEWAPDSSNVWNDLALAHYRAGDWNAAIKAVERSMELDQCGSINRHFMAMAHARLGNEEEARLWYAAATLLLEKYGWKDSPFRAEAAELLGLPRASTQASQPTPPDEVAIHTAILKAHPDAAWAYLNRAKAYSNLHQWDKAVPDFTKGLELKPAGSWRWWNRRGVAYSRLGKWDTAVADYAKAIELKPDGVVFWANRGWSYLRLGQPDKAFADYAKAIELEPNDTHCWNARALAYAELGQWDKALADYTKAIEVKPAEVVFWTNRGNCYLKLGQPDKAFADYAKAIELEPNDVRCWAQRGQAYYELGQWDKALADYAKAIELKPEERSLWNNRGWAYLHLGQRDKAFADFDKAIELEPNDTTSWNKRAEAYCILAQWDKALADYAKAIELKPKETAAWRNRGFVYAEQGLWDRAAAEFAKAGSLDPNDSHVRYIQALMRLRAADTEGYRDDCASMLERLGETTEASPAHWVAWSCALAPDAVGDLAWPVRLAEVSVRRTPKSYVYLQTLGATLYRAGRFDEAIRRLNEAAAISHQAGTGSLRFSPAYTWFFLAMAHHRQGHTTEALEWLGKAVRWAEKVTRENRMNDGSRLKWNRRLTLRLLRKEAESLIVGEGGYTPRMRPDGSVQEAQ